jgi:hypothetical protein
MEEPRPEPSQEDIALQIQHDLVRLRDALVTLSLATRDWLYESTVSRDPDSITSLEKAIDRWKSSGFGRHDI